MAKKINVDGVEIAVFAGEDDDYICLTDMAKVKDDSGRSEIIIQNWLRNRNTVEFLGVWEQMYNPKFKHIEFDVIRSNVGLNSFTLSPKKWIEQTHAIGIVSKQGRYGGTYAHKDIAFEFGAWISATFRLYLIKEYQRLKEIENNRYGLEWDVRRILSKANYTLHTDAIKDYIIPKAGYGKQKEWLLYAEEADLLNIVLFKCTAKDWKEANPDRHLKGENIRDMASINELAILSNLESLNSTLIKHGLTKQQRFKALSQAAEDQRKSLDSIDYLKSIKKLNSSTFIDPKKKGGKKLD